jgi:hypothetical protein
MASTSRKGRFWDGESDEESDSAASSGGSASPTEKPQTRRFERDSDSDSDDRQVKSAQEKQLDMLNVSGVAGPCRIQCV